MTNFGATSNNVVHIPVEDSIKGENSETNVATPTSSRESDSNGTTNGSESETYVSAESEMESVAYRELCQHREEAKQLKEISGSKLQEGDEVIAIPEEWTNRFYNEEFDISDDDIKSEIGPLSSSKILDSSRLNLTEGFQFVPKELFEKLRSWYGWKDGDQVVERRVFYDRSKGRLDVDAWPLCIIPHILTGNAAGINRYKLVSAKPFLISSRSSSKHLKIMVEKSFGLLKHRNRHSLSSSTNTESEGENDDARSDAAKHIKSRIWHIKIKSGSRIPPVLSPGFLNLITEQQVIRTGKKYGGKSLEECHMSSGHVLLEIKRADGSYLMDTNASVRVGDGKVGLVNLGNTCYMNSALQCIAHVPELTYYFLYGFYKKEINRENPLGKKGKLAEAYASLIRHLFDKRMLNNQGSGYRESFSPRDFRYTIGVFNSMFSDYRQQDSQEFLTFLLDGLHEDLNRVLKKPYIEKPELPEGKFENKEEVCKLADDCWIAHKRRNDSVIIDLFVGQYKSTLICPECQHISLTFDPYNDLTLPLPITRKWTHKLKILPETGTPYLLEVELPRSATFYDLKAYVSKMTTFPMNELICIEVFQSQVYKNYEDEDADTQYLPIYELINPEDDIWFYHIKNGPGDAVVPVFSTIGPSVEAARTGKAKAFGIPFFITLTEEERNSYGAIRLKLEERYSQLSTASYFKDMRKNSKPQYEVGDFPNLSDDFKAQLFGLDSENLTRVVSKANPEIPGDFGFSIKLLKGRKVSARRSFGAGLGHHFSYRPFNFNTSFGNTSTESAVGDDEENLWIPQTDGNFDGLKDLLDQLDPIQKEFYEYGDHQKETDEQSNEDVDMKEGDEESGSNIDRSPDMDTNVGRCLLSPSNELQMQTEGRELSKASSTTSILQPVSASSESSTEQRRDEEDSSSTAPQSSSSVPNSSSSSSSSASSIDDEPIVGNKTALVCQWDPEIFDLFFTGLSDAEVGGGKETWTDPREIPNEELKKSREEEEERKKKTITLDDCLQLFSRPEILGENDLWYCPHCQKHQQATKKIEIWSVPDVLAIHLKRFESSRSFSDKIDATVEFPIEGLDMSKYVASEKTHQAMVYDLCAVDNHFGGIGGGHYTAYVRNFVDGEWYYYDDSRVSPADPLDAIRGSAYLLFYRRRSSEALGGDFLKQMYAEILKEREEQKKAAEKIIQEEEAGDVVEERENDTGKVKAQNEDGVESVDMADGRKSDDSLPKRRRKMNAATIGSITMARTGTGESPMSDKEDAMSTVSSMANAPNGDEILSDTL